MTTTQQYERSAERVLRAVLETGLALERARSDAAVAALGLSLSSEDAKMLRDAAVYTVDFAQGLTSETALFARVQVTCLLEVLHLYKFYL
jgi:plasmid stability protein